MSYVNLAKALEAPLKGYIAETCVHSEDTNCFKKHVVARVGFLALTPWSLATSTADILIGIGAGIAVIGTAGKQKEAWDFAMNHLNSSRKIVVRPYFDLLMALNPQAKFSGSIDNMPYVQRQTATLMGQKDAFITVEGDGFITHYVSEALKDVARNCYNSDNFLKRHVASRLTYLLLVISSVITRLMDGIIGVMAAILSFATFGKVESINNLAYRGLQATGIVQDVFYCTTKIINPWAGTKKVVALAY